MIISVGRLPANICPTKSDQADKQPARRPCIYIKAAHPLKEILARLEFIYVEVSTGGIKRNINKS